MKWVLVMDFNFMVFLVLVKNILSLYLFKLLFWKIWKYLESNITREWSIYCTNFYVRLSIVIFSLILEFSYIILYILDFYLVKWFSKIKMIISLINYALLLKDFFEKIHRLLLIIGNNFILLFRYVCRVFKFLHL